MADMRDLLDLRKIHVPGNSSLLDVVHNHNPLAVVAGHVPNGALDMPRTRWDLRRNIWLMKKWMRFALHLELASDPRYWRSECCNSEHDKNIYLRVYRFVLTGGE